MSSLASLIATVCVCAVGISLLRILSPNGVTSKTLNLVTGVFMVCVMILPIKSFITDFRLDISTPEIPESITENAQSAYNTAVIKECESRLSKNLESKLLAEGLGVSSVKVTLGENKDGSIYIDRVNIYINKNERRLNEIITITEEETDVTPAVVSK